MRQKGRKRKKEGPTYFRLIILGIKGGERKNRKTKSDIEGVTRMTESPSELKN